MSPLTVMVPTTVSPPSTVFTFLLHLFPLIITPHSLLQRLIRLLTNGNSIRAPIRRRQTQRFRHRILLRLLDLPQLLPPSLLLLRHELLGCLLSAVALGIPVQIFALLPAAYRCHERVAEVILALSVVLDIIPGEVDAAARAGFADGLEEVHGCWYLVVCVLRLDWWV